MDDLFDHQRAPGFFTLVAGTCVLATQTALVRAATRIAAWLWWLGLGLWFVIMYAFFTAVTVRERKPSLARGINGAWLIAAVATQSIVVSRGAVDGLAAPAPAIQFLCRRNVHDRQHALSRDHPPDLLPPHIRAA